MPSRISEILPLHAKIADKFSLVRSCYHTAAAVHDTGHQMMQTGRLFTGGINTPHAGCAVAISSGRKTDLPPHVILPEPMGPTGGNMPHGQDAGFPRQGVDPFVLMADPSQPDFKVPDLLPPREIGEARLERRRRCARSSTAGAASSTASGQADGQQLRGGLSHDDQPQAREAFDLSKEPQALREKLRHEPLRPVLPARAAADRAGVRFVTINTFLTVFDEITWDIHGSKPFTSIEGMRDIVAPMYDQGYSALIEDLVPARPARRRRSSPAWPSSAARRAINPAGGRDHWPQCFTVYFAGGGVKGGEVIGKATTSAAIPPSVPSPPTKSSPRSTTAGQPLPRRRLRHPGDQGAVCVRSCLRMKVHA
jgi:hypothetical protein